MVGLGVGVGDDQFSFPVISYTASHLMQSSPLWRISSRVYHHDGAVEKPALQGPSSMEEKVYSFSRRETEEEVVVEEKIDMLWEDFFFKEEKPTTEAMEDGKPSPLNKLCFPGAARVVPAGGLLRLVTVVKLLKKMFLIRRDSEN